MKKMISFACVALLLAAVSMTSGCAIAAEEWGKLFQAIGDAGNATGDMYNQRANQYTRAANQIGQYNSNSNDLTTYNDRQVCPYDSSSIYPTGETYIQAGTVLRVYKCTSGHVFGSTN